MRKITALILLFALMLPLCACGAEEALDPILPDGFRFTSIKTMEEQLTGKTREDLIEIFGEPIDTLAGRLGDVFRIPYSELVLFAYYNAEGTVFEIDVAEPESETNPAE